MNVSVCIQHHPARAHLLGPLLDALGPAEIVTDPDPGGRPSAWRTYRHALEQTPVAASHRLIVQDDVTAAARFREVLDQAVADHPDRLIALFVAGAPAASAQAVRRAHARGAPYAELPWRSWTPTVALCWPATIAHDFLEWVRGGNAPAQRGDDAIVGRYVRDRRHTVIAVVPSVVEHPDVEPSLVGRNAGRGRNRLRCAAVYRP